MLAGEEQDWRCDAAEIGAEIDRRRFFYPLDVILICVCRYVVYPLSLRNIEEMMAERGVTLDHSTVHRWAVKLLPVLEKAFRLRKRPVGKSWRMYETYIRVKGEWRYLYRAVDKYGNTIDFLLRAHRDKTAARRYFERSIARLLRQYFPKGTDLSRWSAREIQAVPNTLNSTLRKTLGWKMRVEALDEDLKSVQQSGVATTD